MDVMNFLVPITHENLYSLRPGEWIWDNQIIQRRIHKRDLDGTMIDEPAGFRQIDILDLDFFPRWSSTPFMLSEIDSGRSSWVYFEEGRFYMFKRDKEETE